MNFRDIVDNLKEKGVEIFQIKKAGEVKEITTLLTDSRNTFTPEETLFFAISTPNGNDGHKFLPELYYVGVRNFVVEKIPENFKGKDDVNLVQVEDSLKALSSIGSLHRDNAEKVIAIIGSRGKTTVKEISFQAMEPLRKISRSPRSYNSKIGVPLSLWAIPESTELAIIEAGISRKGEMKNLSDIVNPDTVVFTNIGDAHAEGFSSIEEKAKEKALMASSNTVKAIVYPADDSLISRVLKKYETGKKMIGWSLKDENAPLFIKIEESGQKDKRQLNYKWEGENHSILIPYDNVFDLENMVNVLAIMLLEGFTAEEISERFSQISKIETRMNVSEGINGCSVILDSYTSDLSSLKPAIDFTLRRKMPGQSLTLIMSDLLHETENLDSTYHNISKIIKESGISRFIGIGPTMKSYSRFFPEGSAFYEDKNEFLKNESASDFFNEIILLKGAPEYGFKDIFRQLEARNHETVLEVNLDAMIRNYNYFRHHVPSATGIIAMVKAFGYGVGSYEIAKTLQDMGAAYLAVAVLDEGIDLRKNGITMPVMIMNPRSANYKALFSNRLEPVVYSMKMLKELIGEAKKNKERHYPVHIKLDTGMHRMGFMEEELPELSIILKENKNLQVASVFSHLATADCMDMDSFTLKQIGLFEKMSTELISTLGYPVKRHILNSAGIIRFPEYHYDFVRLGIGLYGANTLPKEIEKPLSVVATLRSVIICIREIEAGEAVGYSRKGLAAKKSRIATVPIGYADGIDRRFGNGNLHVFINGKEAPTIGNICMDATMIDVSEIECKEGDTVEIFGENVSLQRLADNLQTIPYEILTSVSPRVKRVYYRE